MVGKIKASAVVVNSLAVWLSHTVKLAEFLALHKAIISNPISRELPAPLLQDQHVHDVDGSVDSRAAVTSILKDRNYRMHFERCASILPCLSLSEESIERLVND